ENIFACYFVFRDGDCSQELWRSGLLPPAAVEGAGTPDRGRVIEMGTYRHWPHDPQDTQGESKPKDHAKRGSNARRAYLKVHAKKQESAATARLERFSGGWRVWLNAALCLQRVAADRGDYALVSIA